jgi:hypothetical protein
VSLATTNMFAEVHPEFKAKTADNREVDGKASSKPGKKDAGLIDLLRTL